MLSDGWMDGMGDALTGEMTDVLYDLWMDNTMMGTDSFLGSLLVLSVELWKGIAG